MHIEVSGLGQLLGKHCRTGLKIVVGHVCLYIYVGADALLQCTLTWFASALDRDGHEPCVSFTGVFSLKHFSFSKYQLIRPTDIQLALSGPLRCLQADFWFECVPNIKQMPFDYLFYDIHTQRLPRVQCVNNGLFALLSAVCVGAEPHPPSNTQRRGQTSYREHQRFFFTIWKIHVGHIFRT